MGELSYSVANLIRWSCLGGLDNYFGFCFKASGPSSQCSFQVQESWPRLGNKMVCVEGPLGDSQNIEVTPSKDDDM